MANRSSDYLLAIEFQDRSFLTCELIDRDLALVFHYLIAFISCQTSKSHIRSLERGVGCGVSGVEIGELNDKQLNRLFTTHDVRAVI